MLYSTFAFAIISIMQEDFLSLPLEAAGLDVQDSMSAELRNKILATNKEILVALLDAVMRGATIVPWP